MNRKILFTLVAGLLLLTFIAGIVVFQKQKATQQAVSVNQHQGVLERQGAPVKGPADARVTIVEFFDPACGTCRDFYPLVRQFIDQYPGKVKVILRYAPLHTGSDQVVKMLEAAHYQGKFWQALELLFSNQDRWVINHTSQPMRARTILNELDLDQERLTSDMNNPAVIRAIQLDVANGQALNVRATPEFFVNGQPLPSFGYAQLRQLVAEAVAQAY
jgi:protein-disulfide isomerase